MEAKKKRTRTRVEIQGLKKRERRIARAVFLAFILLIVVLSAYYGSTSRNQSSEQADKSTSELKAVIVDQASLSPAGGFDEVFVENVSSILEQAGYNVDYYPGEQVTVEFFRNLPTHGYKVLILRVHSLTDTFQGRQMVGFFTSELYSTARYVYEQLTDQIGSLGYYPNAQTRYFGVTQEFVKSSMNGRFDNAAIVMTGCEGLNNTKMAEAFVQRGAKVYIGWDGTIFFSHTDAATINLLRHALIDKQIINQAVENTMREVGPDPAENSSLIFYPLEAGEQTIENLSGKG